MKNRDQLLRFALVGGVNTVLDFGLLFALRSLGVPIIAANILSTGVAFIFSFFANRKYTFKSNDPRIFRQIFLFVFVTLFGLWVLQTLVINLTLPFFESLTNEKNISLIISKLFATVVSLTWNYLLYDRVVFNAKNIHR